MPITVSFLSSHGDFSQLKQKRPFLSVSMNGSRIYRPEDGTALPVEDDEKRHRTPHMGCPMALVSSESVVVPTGVDLYDANQSQILCGVHRFLLISRRSSMPSAIRRSVVRRVRSSRLLSASRASFLNVLTFSMQFSWAYSNARCSAPR